MATVAVEQERLSDADLEKAVEKLDKQIEHVQVDLADWRSQSQTRTIACNS